MHCLLQKIYILLITTLIYSYQSYSQCSLDTIVVLTETDNEGPDTTNISLLVNGAALNDLSSGNQGVCGVLLKFRHPFMKELSIELISPSGQSVILTGGNIDATNTPFITWDVALVTCAAAAAPDPGFGDFWENDQDWQNFNTYTGQYYPYSGCLEDFNTGPVNGTWTLRCIDFEDEGQGRVLDASLVFCEDEGISCSRCNLNPGMIANEGFTSCSGDERLKFGVIRDFGGGNSPDSSYLYYNTVFSDSSIVFHGSDTLDLRSYPPGTYTVCITQIAKIQAGILPPADTLLNADQLRNFFFTKGACAALSDTCIQITIRDGVVRDTTLRYFCKGGSFTLGDSLITSPGIYLIAGDHSDCDTLRYLNLQWVNTEPVIRSTADSLPCIPVPVTLTVEFDTISGATYTYSWFRNQLPIPEAYDSSRITTTLSGLYAVVVATDFSAVSCQDTARFLLRSSGTAPEIMVQTDTITCLKDTVSAIIISNSALASVKWMGEDGTFSGSGDSIRIWKGGLFSVEAVGTDGCASSLAFTIPERTDTIALTLETEIITCRNPLATVTLVPESLPASVVWELPPGVMSPAPGILSFNSGIGGMYSCSVVNEWGCTSSIRELVMVDTISPVVAVRTDTITCKNPEVTLLAESPLDPLVYRWTNPANEMLQGPVINTSVSGLYMLVAENPINGCIANIRTIVEADLGIPLPAIAPSFTIPCSTGTVFLSATANTFIEEYIWTLPDGSTLSMPTPEVATPGMYSLQLSGSNGCLSDPVGFQVVQGTFSGDFTLSIDSLTCKNQQVRLEALSSDTSLRFMWKLPNGDLASGKFVTSLRAGQGSLKVIDTLGCEKDTAFQIFADTLSPALSILQDGNFSCSVSEVRLKANQEIKPFISGNWATSDGKFDPGSDNTEIFALQAGTYRFTSVNNRNGCKKESQITLDQVESVFDKVITDIKASSCRTASDGSIVLSDLNGKPPYKIKLGTKDLGSELTITGLSPGNYTLMITDSNGCMLSRDITIDVLPTWSVNLPKEIKIEFGDSVILKPELVLVDPDDLQFIWKKAGREVCAGCPELTVRPYENTVYTLEYTVGGQCSGKVEVLVRVTDNLRFSIPTVFYPGSSSGNNRFYIPRQLGIERIEFLHVFGPWAENVFSVSDVPPGLPETGWDGTFNGKEVSPGVYVVIARLKLTSGATWLYQGDVLLVR